MTSQDPEQIRTEIERTRANLSEGVDALTDKVSPRRVVERQTERVRGAVSGARDAVFGSATDTAEATGAAASSVASRVGDAPRDVVNRTRGNPLAAGLVAFGLGLLASSLIPASRREKELVEASKQSEPVQNLTESAKEVAGDVKDSLREPVRQAAARVKATASEGAAEVREAAQSGAEHVRGETQEAVSNVEETRRQHE